MTMVSITAAWQEGVRCLQVSTTPHQDAARLLAHVLACPIAVLYREPDQILDPEQYQNYLALIRARAAGKSVAVLVGYQGFWDWDLVVNDHVLIPRPETEHLVEAAQRWYTGSAPRILDLGTGSGALAVALAQVFPDSVCDAVDCSREALSVAQCNAVRCLGPDQTQIHFYHGDWFAAVAHQPTPLYDIVITNPPYLAIAEWEAARASIALSSIHHEPYIALVAGPTGLEAYQAIVSAACAFLQPGGLLIGEHGWTQQDQVCHLLRQSGFTLYEKGVDLQGHPRFVVAAYRS